jgi:hypothetical protein
LGNDAAAGAVRNVRLARTRAKILTEIIDATRLQTLERFASIVVVAAEHRNADRTQRASDARLTFQELATEYIARPRRPRAGPLCSAPGTRRRRGPFQFAP